MKITKCSNTILLFLFSISVLAEETKDIHSLKQTSKGDILYSRFTFYFLKGEHTSTNYRMGTLIPVNSKFEFVKTSWPKLLNKPPFKASGFFRVKHLQSGQIIKIVNKKEYSGSNISGYFLKMFSKDKIDLSPYTKTKLQHILTGRVISGMSRKEAILSLGYPPAHRTPSLNNPVWYYWNSKFGTFTVQFIAGKTTKPNPTK